MGVNWFHITKVGLVHMYRIGITSPKQSYDSVRTNNDHQCIDYKIYLVMIDIPIPNIITI
jgi:hypothetical protein